MRKRCENADEGVVLVAIQIAVDSDLSTEERCLRVPQPLPLSLLDQGVGDVTGLHVC